MEEDRRIREHVKKGEIYGVPGWVSNRSLSMKQKPAKKIKMKKCEHQHAFK